MNNSNQSSPKHQRRQNGHNFRPNSGSGNKQGNPKSQGLKLGSSGSSRGQAIRASRRNSDRANQTIDGANIANPEASKHTNMLPIKESGKLRVLFLGGQSGIGEKNMVVIEYDNEAVITDCGNELGLDLPGINYAVADASYLEKIQNKLKAYIISHGHLDHIGGLPHIMTKYPAPVYGSTFSIGMVKKALRNVAESAELAEKGRFIEMNIDGHERLMAGKHFTIELVRITHSIPESTLIVVDTPIGRIINTGDFRLDPEPLDRMPSDIERIKQLGDEGVLLLLSESTNAQKPGRTPTEHTLQDSFHEIIKNAKGRIFVASFSSNLNRIQMVINSAAEAGRKIAIDGRSMIQHVELAVRLGLLRVPKGQIATLAEVANLPDEQILVMCTGGQGEQGAALQRMSIGEHRHIKLRQGDTVVISSTPIPGNNVAYEKLGDDLALLGVKQFRSPNWEVDGALGPLHVSGHACRDEHREMLEMTRPKFFVPTYAGALHRGYHRQIAIEQIGMPMENTFMLNNGDALEIDEKHNAKPIIEAVHAGSVLVDDSSQVVPSVVVKDRLLLSETGLVVAVLTVDRRSGNLVTSPDIITRGFIYIRDNEELMNLFRGELKRAVSQRFKRVELDRFKSELKDHITHFLYEQTQRTPIVIPVVNVIGRSAEGKQSPDERKRYEAELKKELKKQHERFDQLRANLRTQDQPD